jgi:DNA-binding IscR family transcriptional regulator
MHNKLEGSRVGHFVARQSKRRVKKSKNRTRTAGLQFAKRTSIGRRIATISIEARAYQALWQQLPIPRTNILAICQIQESVVMTGNFMLGDGALHQRLCAITEILGKFVGCAPRQLSIRNLVESTGRCENDLENLCAELTRAALLQSNLQLPGSWSLACAPDKVTLEDVFRCVMTEQPVQGQPSAADFVQLAGRQSQRVQYDVDLLVTQAAMAINQSVFQHLRQFSLDRLKFSSAAVYNQSKPAPTFRQFPRDRLDPVANSPFLGWPASVVGTELQ